MTFVLSVISAVIAAWALVARRLERWQVRAPLLLVLAGVVTGLFTQAEIAARLNSHVAQQMAEVILAVLLFVDASELPGGRLLGRDPGSALRALLMAMPLSLVMVIVLGLLLMPTLPVAVLLLIACIIVPIDFAAAETLVRDPDIPERVRSVINVESGYNDGIISPIFLFALILAGSASVEPATPALALQTAVPFAVKALLVGLPVGALIAWLMNLADGVDWMTGQSRRIIVLATPLLAYTATVGLGGNGFVASFACGIVFRYVREATVRRHRAPADRASDFRLIDDTVSIMTMCMWFFFGNAVVLAFAEGVGWAALLLCLAALTVARIVPVLIAFVGSPLTARERLLVGVLGPRGTTSIVFGLLAFNSLPEGPHAFAVIETTTLAVLGSVLLFGPGLQPLVRRFGAQQPAQS